MYHLDYLPYGGYVEDIEGFDYNDRCYEPQEEEFKTQFLDLRKLVFNEMDAFNVKLKEEEEKWEKFRGYEEDSYDDNMVCIDKDLEKEVREAAAQKNNQSIERMAPTYYDDDL